MLVSMINNDAEKATLLVIAFSTETMERMALADPITILSEGSGGVLPPPKYPGNFNVMVAYEPDEAAMIEEAKMGNLVQYINRGFKMTKEDLEGKVVTITPTPIKGPIQ